MAATEAGKPSAGNYSPQEIIGWTYRADAVARCFVLDVLQMQAFGGYYQLGTFPCQFAELVGVIVGVQVYEKRTQYALDDGTGVIECSHRHESTLRTPPAIGDTTRCRGKIMETHWHERRLDVDILDVLHDPTEEPRYWLHVAQIHQTVYRLPFAMPELVIGIEPMTPKRAKGRSNVPMTGSSVAASSSAASTPHTSPFKLRQPSKLRRKELTTVTFLHYLKECMHSLSAALAAPAAPDTNNTFATPTKVRPEDPDLTPKPRGRSESPSRYIPTYGKKRKDKPIVRPQVSTEPPGFTLSYLRRIPQLAELALLVVRAEAHRREKERLAEEKAKGERPAKEKVKGARVKARSRKPEDEAEKAKRLFAWAVRKLRQEGAIVLGVGPARTLADLDVNLIGSLWSSQTQIDQSLSNTASSINASIFSDYPPLSPPTSNEETYLPVTASLLAPPVLEAFIGCIMKQGKAGTTPEDILSRVRRDARWEHLGIWDVERALEFMEQEERVCKIGGGHWGLI